MTEFYKGLKLKKASPSLWVKTIALFESQKEEPTRIVSLRRGINVIWAHEPADLKMKGGAEQVGHGVGKTSFCLLLRYCLCDKGKAIDALRDELSEEFPAGGVAAIVSINGDDWAVFRPYAKHKRSVAVKSGELSILQEEDVDNAFQDYEKAFNDELLKKLESDVMPETGQKIQWQHVLGWITRDQSARFLNYYHWREGEGSKLQRSKEDPPALLRLILGLISAEEIGLLDKLKEAEVNHSHVFRDLRNAEEKPSQILTRIESELRRWGNYSEDIPLQSEDLFSPSVLSLVTEECDRDSVGDPGFEKLQAELEEAIVSKGLVEKRRDSCLINKEIISAVVKGSLNDLKSAQDRKLNILALSGYCPVCDLLFNQCSHAREEANRLDIRLKRDQVSFSDLAKEYSPKLDAASRQLAEAESELSQANENLAKLRRQLSVLQTKNIDRRYRVNKGRDLLEEFKVWDQRKSARENKEIFDLTSQLQSKKVAFDSLKLKVERVRRSRSNRELQLSNLVANMADSLLGKGSFGRFDSEDTEFPFKLSIGCEAYRVLSVLLGDFAVLLFSAIENTAFPGMLVHDCPREADMSVMLYQHLLEQFLVIETSLEVEPPYQYILTTTTPPPTSLQKLPFVRLELRPDDEAQMLFGQRFQSQMSSLFNRGGENIG